MRRVETEIAGVSGNYDRFSMARHISRHADNKVTTQAGVNVMRGGGGESMAGPAGWYCCATGSSSLVARR